MGVSPNAWSESLYLIARLIALPSSFSLLSTDMPTPSNGKRDMYELKPNTNDAVRAREAAKYLTVTNLEHCRHARNIMRTHPNMGEEGLTSTTTRCNVR